MDRIRASLEQQQLQGAYQITSPAWTGTYARYSSEVYRIHLPHRRAIASPKSHRTKAPRTKRVPNIHSSRDVKSFPLQRLAPDSRTSVSQTPGENRPCLS